MLDHLAHRVLLPIQEAVVTRTAALRGAIETYCTALDAGQPGPAADAARAAYRETLDAWERADAVLVGPAAMDNRTVRDRIYGWPLFSTCGVDRDTPLNFTNPAGYDVGTKLTNVRTLAAVEYLLFSTSTAHTCASAPPGWDALGADLPRAKCRQALAIAADVAKEAAALGSAWRADGGDYAGVLARAGQCESPIATAHEGVNLVSDGLFYVDAMVKDMKLAESAGISMNACGTVGQPCLREVEAQYADRASFAIRANLSALREVFTGETTGSGAGPGFDDFLRALGTAEVADRMASKLDAAIAAAATLPDSFLTALSTDYAKVVATHGAIDAFTDDLKSQFLTILALDIPDDVAADND
jgi:uncharacterized protein